MSRKVRFIGDLHGKYMPYLGIIDNPQDPVHESVQVGDFGFGFGTLGDADFIDTLYNDVPGTHRMIRGNHDNVDEAKLSKHFIADGTVDDRMMFVGGAASIDRQWRTPGLDWWDTEELSQQRLEMIVTDYDRVRPDIMVTHDCPEFFAKEVMIPYVNGINGFPSRTRDAFDSMFALRKPEIWIFGHWHKGIDYMYRGTRFICLPELGYIDLEV